MAIATVTFFYGGVAEKKKAMATTTITFFYGGVAEKKKATITIVAFLFGYVKEKMKKAMGFDRKLCKYVGTLCIQDHGSLSRAP
jgi:hypothetical protein